MERRVLAATQIVRSGLGYEIAPSMHYEHQVRVHGNHHSYSTSHNRAITDYGNKNGREMGGENPRVDTVLHIKEGLHSIATVAGPPNLNTEWDTQCATRM